jgi:hypothetical protein
MWLSRETILDYWLSAWVAASLVLLRKTEGFQYRLASLLLGLVLALGLLTKWLFAGWVLLPLVYVFVRQKVWTQAARIIRMADTILIAGVIAGLWYIPKLPTLVQYFGENARIGAREGEPPIFSFQSLIYYLRLLEGYQLFAPLFLFVVASCVMVYKKKCLQDGAYLAFAVTGGWLALTLLRTKDARFTMPVLGLLAIVAGAWIQSWRRTWVCGLSKGLLVAVMAVQAYAVNFGISWLPDSVVLAEGYHGYLRWDWNLYLQHYFNILGPPRREDWKQVAVLRRMTEHAAQNGLRLSLAVIPDLPFFNAANFLLYARLMGMRAHMDHLQAEPQGLTSFEGFDYVLMKERDQGTTWTTVNNRALNRIIVDAPRVFQLLGLYELPDGDFVRLYAIRR